MKTEKEISDFLMSESESILNRTIFRCQQGKDKPRLKRTGGWCGLQYIQEPNVPLPCPYMGESYKDRINKQEYFRCNK